MTKLSITRSNGIWLLPILFALFTLNAVGDTLSFAAVQIDPSYNPPFPPPPGTNSASYSAVINGDTNSAAANLATGMLGVLNAGHERDHSQRIRNLRSTGRYHHSHELGIRALWIKPGS